MPLIDDGVPVLLITKLLFLDEQSIHNLLQRYQLGKIDVLLDNHYHGKESMLTDEQADQLHQHVADNIYMDCILVIAYILLEFGTSYSWSGVQHQGENKYIEPFSDLLNIYGMWKYLLTIESHAYMEIKDRFCHRYSAFVLNESSAA